ncbi:MAG: hypothetical protein ACRDPM_18255 [Solirubrobacteraceae bacterium]
MTDELLDALASTWAEIRAHHREVPSVVLAVGEGSRRATKTVCLGCYSAIGWCPVY